LVDFGPQAYSFMLRAWGLVGHPAVGPFLLPPKPLVDYVLLGIGPEALQQVQGLLSLVLQQEEIITFSVASPSEISSFSLSKAPIA
jgi:hypothetical protein